MIENTNTKVTYTADGVQSIWPVPFPFVSTEDVLLFVTKDGVTAKITTNFEWNVEKTAITYPTTESKLPKLAAGDILLLQRVTPRTQEENASEARFSSSDVERALDKLTLITQELAGEGLEQDCEEALSAAEEAKQMATEAKNIANDSKATAEGLAADIQVAKDQAAAAVEAAQGAIEKADAADEKAATALAEAEEANASAQTALSISENIDGKATEALETAQNAMTNASDAKTEAEAASAAIEVVDGKADGALADIADLETTTGTLRNDVDELGDQVHEIEAKIPQEAGSSNQLADKAFVNSKIAEINFIKWVTALPTIGETKYLYAIARDEQDLEGHHIAALYVWDGDEWRGAGGYSLNIDPDTIATKTYVTDITNALDGRIDTIDGLIPSEASADNKLADKEYVKTSISGANHVTVDTGQTISGRKKFTNQYLELANGTNTVLRMDGTNALRSVPASNLLKLGDGRKSIQIDSAEGIFVSDNENVGGVLLHTGNKSRAIASETALGFVKVGDGLSVTGDGILSADVKDVQELTSDVDSLKTKMGAVEEKIPTEASSANQLADKAYVDAAVDLSGYLLKSEAEEEYAGKADTEAAVAALEQDVDTRLTQTQADGLYASKDTTYSKTEVDNAITEAVGDIDMSKVVTLDTTQEITGQKTFTKALSTPTLRIPYKAGFSCEIEMRGVRAIEDTPTYFMVGKTGTELRLQTPQEVKIYPYQSSSYPSGTVIHTGNKTRNIASADSLGFVKVGDGLSIAEDGTLSATGGSSTTGGDEGIKGDYCTTYGILESPNGILENPGGMEVKLKQGVVLQLSGATGQTTISGDMTQTLTSTSDCDLFYVSGTSSLMEVANIVWSKTEPDNGATGVLAWWNPDNGKWKFKSNDEGNVWAEANATPIAHIHTDGTTITRIDHIGYRVLNREVYMLKKDFFGTRVLGEVYYSQSSSQVDNAGALPLFTGETIESADTIYPEFYAWVNARASLKCDALDYRNYLNDYGECPFYVVDNGSLRLPKLTNYIKAANTTDGIKPIAAGLPAHTHDIDVGTGYYNDNSGTSSAKATGTQAGRASFTRQTGEISSSNIYGQSDTVTPPSTTLYPWVVAYTAAVPASTAQAAEFQQSLSGKADTDLSNIPSAYDYVIESQAPTADNPSWYRKYKSGWVEQGGFTTLKTVTLLKAMQDTNYTVLCTQRGTSDPTRTEGSPRSGAMSTTQIFVNGGGEGTPQVNYYVCGLGASSTSGGSSGDGVPEKEV